MSKFNSLLENHLKTTDLLRIRVKFDPANESDERREYIGYVLEETSTGGVVAIVPGIGPDSMSFEPGEYEMDQSSGCGDPLSSFKKHLVNFLMTRGYHEKVSEQMEYIINSNDLIELENMVKTCDCDGSVVLDLYRDYVSNV